MDLVVFHSSQLTFINIDEAAGNVGVVCPSVEKGRFAGFNPRNRKQIFDLGTKIFCVKLVCPC